MNLGLSIRFNFLKNTSEKTAEKQIDKVRKLLETKQNDYELKKRTSLLNPAYADELDINPSAYILVNFDTGEVIAEKNSDKRLPIASITKVMTAIVALDLAKKEEVFGISHNAASQVPTKIGVVEGERMELSELLKASMLTSANDATEVIREGIDKKYNEEIFIKAMNIKSKLIGLKNTNFSNPQGFDDSSNYSTAEDLAILSNYALTKYPSINEIAGKDYEFLPNNSTHKSFDLQNWNGLIGVYPGVKGLKIGNTNNAGKTTIVVAKRNGETLTAIVLGAPGIIERDLWAASLLDYGFEKKLRLARFNVTKEELLQKYSEWEL